MTLAAPGYSVRLGLKHVMMLIALCALGCSTTPPSVKTTNVPPDLPTVMAASQSLLTDAETLIKDVALCKQLALQAAQNAFAVEEECKDELIAALKEGSLEAIQACSDKVDLSSGDLRNAVQQSSKVIQLEAAARTAVETAQRKFKIATQEEDAGKALASFALADTASREALERGRAASALSSALKERWLVMDPAETESAPTAPAAPAVTPAP